jgi:hypothetical protein
LHPFPLSAQSAVPRGSAGTGGTSYTTGDGGGSEMYFFFLGGCCHPGARSCLLIRQFIIIIAGIIKMLTALAETPLVEAALPQTHRVLLLW